MISKYIHKELTWIDLESPKEEEIDYILDEYSIPSYIKEKLKNTITSDEISMDYDYIFASINFSQVKSAENTKSNLIFIINDSFIISIHSDPIEALREFINEIELNINSAQKLDISNNKILFAHLLKNLLKKSQNELLKNEMKIKELKEKEIKNRKKLKLLTKLSFFSLGAIILILIYVFSHI